MVRGISNCQFCYKTPKAEKLLCVFEIRKLMYFNHPHLIISTGLHFLSLQKKINIFYIKHKKYAIDYGAIPSRIEIIRYGSLIEGFYFENYAEKDINFKNNLKKISSSINFLFVGRMEKLKYADDILSIFIDLVSSHPNKNFKLFMVGDGSLFNTFQDKIIERGMSESIILHRHLNQFQLYELYNICEVFVSPLAGRALCEASLSNCLTLAYNLDWQSEIISNNKTGILIKEPFRENLAKKVKNILDDHSPYSELANNLRI